MTHVTLDNQMPVMTGVEAAGLLREGGCRARIVGLTGNTVGRDGEEFLRAGVDVVLGKPVDQEALLAGLLLSREGSTEPTISEQG